MTDAAGYTDIAREYVPIALKGFMMFALSCGVIATAFYLAASVHLYISPIALLSQSEYSQAFQSNPNWYYPATTVVCAICSILVANAVPEIDNLSDEG